MFFSNLYKSSKRTLSFEFFPPRTEADLTDSKQVLATLAEFQPSFMTVTSGMEQIKRDLSRTLVAYSKNELKVPGIAHQTCWGLSRDEVEESLAQLEKEGINLVLALRGDPSKKFTEREMAVRGFENALEFTQYIIKRGGFEVVVAGYPETHRDAFSPTSDLEYLKKKVDAGAQLIITQLFFDPATYFEFLEKTTALGISVPIIPGILPISSATQLDRFVSLTGVKVPDEVRAGVEKFGENPAELGKWGLDYAIRQSRDLLLGGAPGVHLYTLNKADMSTSYAQAILEYL